MGGGGKKGREGGREVVLRSFYPAVCDGFDASQNGHFFLSSRLIGTFSMPCHAMPCAAVHEADALGLPEKQSRRGACAPRGDSGLDSPLAG